MTATALPAPKRNILLVVADQWRGDTLGALNHPCVRTPNIDRLAARGVTFARHYVQACPCAPGRASLLTGTYMMTHRVVRNGVPLDGRLLTLPRLARAAGYEPALIGYTTTTPDPRDVPRNDPRFEVPGHIMDGWTEVGSFAPEKRPYMAWLARRGYDVPRRRPTEIWLPPDDYPAGPGQGPTHAPSRLHRDHSDTAWFTEHALQFLAVPHPRPWLLHLGYYRPHPPYIVPEPYHALYDPADVPAPVRAADAQSESAQHPFLAYILATKKQKNFFMHGKGLVADLDEGQIRQIRATYYGMMTELDDHLGRVLDRLEASGEIAGTLIVFTSDHGEQLGDHHMLGKQGYFDESFHVPLIVVDPDPAADAARGARVTRFTECVDVLPTLLEWIGQDIPRQCDGRSLMPFLRGQVPPRWRRHVHYEYDFREIRSGAAQNRLGLALDDCALAVVQDDDFKYVHFAGGLPPLFFDLRDDPRQLRDRAGDPARQGDMLAYARHMLDWRLAHAQRTLMAMEAGCGGLYERREGDSLAAAAE
jgi:arylsulfatase A-like enzyme